VIQDLSLSLSLSPSLSLNRIKSINEIPEDLRGDANAGNEVREVLQHFDTVSIE